MTTVRHGLQSLHAMSREGARGLSASLLALDASIARGIAPEDLIARYGEMPILLDHPVSVALLSIEPNGTIDEHDAPTDTLFIVIEGSGFVRVGGPDAQEAAVAAGDAVLWPSNVLHMVWTTDQAMRAITLEFS